MTAEGWHELCRWAVENGVRLVNDAAYAGIREAHLNRIQDAQGIVDKNVQTLLSMVQTVGQILREIDTQRETPE